MSIKTKKNSLLNKNNVYKGNNNIKTKTKKILRGGEVNTDPIKIEKMSYTPELFTYRLIAQQ